MAIKTIKLRRATASTTDISSISDKKLAYGEPMYNEADKIIVVGDFSSTDADLLDRVDLIPVTRSKKEVFWVKSTDSSGSVKYSLYDIDGNLIPIGEDATSYTAGNGINVSSANVISIKRDPSYPDNGLSVTANGLALKEVSTTEAGAMPSSALTKLNNLSKIESSTTNGNIKIDGTEVAVYTLPIASPAILGGIKIGDGLDINASGVVSTTLTPISVYIQSDTPTSPTKGSLWFKTV